MSGIGLLNEKPLHATETVASVLANIVKPLVCTLMILLGCTFFSAHPAQNPAESEAELEKQIKECEVPNKEKPKGEIKRVSQLCGHAMSLPKAAVSRGCEITARRGKSGG